MATPQASQALVLLFIAAMCFVSSVTASVDSPFIVAHKKVALKRLKSGAEEVTVSIDIYNEGFATAYDVSLTDDGWPRDTFEVVSGNTSRSWERLDAGGQVSHSFQLESKVKGRFEGAPAVIKFRVPTKAALQEAYSTPILPLDILEDRAPERRFQWAQKLLAKYGSLVSVISLVTLFVYVVATPSKSSVNKKKR
ncbi:hypothetical protein Droror1_Dr00014099 [Drosera rotundifolia]